MARQQSQAQLMFVPTPECVITRVRSFLRIPPGCVALDPCCGEAVALKQLAPDGRRYGIELELDRAKVAKQNTDKVLSCAMQDARVTNGCFGLMLLNPPYDDSTEGRLEEVFIDKCSRYLVPGGVMVHVVKEGMYRHLTRRLKRNFDVLGHWRFPDGWYDGPELAFTQTVLICRKRAEPATSRDTREFYDVDLGMNSLEPMPESFDEQADVPIGHEPTIFVSATLSPEELRELIAASPLSRQMDTPGLIGCGSPPVPLKQGHVALVLASGVVNGVYGSSDDGTLHVAKGCVVRKETTQTVVADDNGGAVIKKVTDSFAIQVRCLHPDGEITTIGVTADTDGGDS